MIEIGQMFVQFPSPIAELQQTPTPRVWVKVANENGYSLFVDNNAIVKMTIKAIDHFGIRDKWMISDGYYGDQVMKFNFIPVADLNEAESVCKERGYETPLIEF